MAEPTSVLLVEDNDYDVHRVEKALSGSETTTFELEHVETLAGAVDRVEASSPDVVLLDLGLSDSRGLDTLERFREAHAEVPVVVLTGLRDEETALSAVTSGAHDYLVKDHLDTFRLVHAIRYALERHALAKEAESALRGMAAGGTDSAASALILGATDQVRASTTVVANALIQIRQTLETAETAHPGGIESGLSAADEVDGAVRRIDDLLKTLRRFFGAGDRERRRVSLHEPTVAAVYLFQSVTDQRIGVDADLEATAPVAWEMVQVQRLVLDILETVADALPPGTIVRVATRDRPAAARLEVCADGELVDGATLDLDELRRAVESHDGRLDRSTGSRLGVVVDLPTAASE